MKLRTSTLAAALVAAVAIPFTMSSALAYDSPDRAQAERGFYDTPERELTRQQRAEPFPLSPDLAAPDEMGHPGWTGEQEETSVAALDEPQPIEDVAEAEEPFPLSPDTQPPLG